MLLLIFQILQVFSEDLDKDMIILLAARASRMENKDAIDTAITGMLADPNEVKDYGAENY